jgi:DNA invertase Pin-like site-specific DNA recombinase
MDIGYARVSTKDQDNQIQREALARAGCDRIVEEKRSGVADRPVRAEVLKQLQPGDTLTVHRLDRLGRSVGDLLAVAQDLEQRHIKLRCVAQPVDTSSAAGRLFLTVLAAVAAMERELLLERTADGKRARVERGLHPGGRPLFGLEPDHVTVNPVEAQALDEIAQAILDEGLNLSQVVELLNADPDAFPRPRRGGQWRVSGLHRVLTNPRAELVIPDHYRALQPILRRKQGQGQGGGRPAGHLLSGILTCSKCNSPMYSFPKVKDGRRELFYRCKPAKGSGGRFYGCGSMFIAEGRADRWAEEMFYAAVVAEEFAQALTVRQAEILDQGVNAADLDEWRAEIADLETMAPTRFYTEDHRRRHADLRRMVDQATAQLLAAPDLQQMLDLPRSEEELRRTWAGWSLETRRAWLRRLVERIEVRPATAKGRGSDVESRLVPVFKL